jgi:putative ABC transport system permease protein
MKFILRNMWRRKARTFLTIFGIVVGIFALTVLGGLSARLTQQVQGAKTWYTSKISIVPPGSSIFGGQESYLDLSKIDEIEAVPGVKIAVAGIGVQLEQGSSGFGAPELIIGSDLRGAEDELSLIKLREGRILKDGDTGKVLLGSALAEKYNAQIGDTVVLKNVPFEVVGIYETTLSAPDSFAFVSYRDAMDIYRSSSQFTQSDEVKGFISGVLRDYVSEQQAGEIFQRIFPSIQGKDIAATIDVIPESGVDMEMLSQRIADEIPGIRVISPKEAEKQISQFSLIFNAILLGIGFIALIVGGLSIINTMIMSVSERTQEIGLKKAIGAETRSILGEYLLESSMIGFLGGLIGMLLGLLTIYLLNNATKSNNTVVFAVTNTVIFGPVIFSVVLGTLAGIIPAYRASRLKPVDALKED